MIGSRCEASPPAFPGGGRLVVKVAGLAFGLIDRPTHARVLRVPFAFSRGCRNARYEPGQQQNSRDTASGNFVSLFSPVSYDSFIFSPVFFLSRSRMLRVR